MLFNSYFEIENFIENLIREYIYDFKFERMNLCFFKRNYKQCSYKQLNYLQNLLENNCDYYLSDTQRNYLSKLSVREISVLINTIKNIEIELTDNTVTVPATEVEGSIYYNKSKEYFYSK